MFKIKKNIFPVNILKIRKIRENLKKSQNVNHVFTEEQWKNYITIHYTTLMTYVNNFYVVLYEFIQKAPKKRVHKVIDILGEKKINKILKNKIRPTIQDIFLIYRSLNLKKNFENYFVSKTHLSFSFEKNHKIEPLGYFSKTNNLVYLKFSEFVYLILSEYVILHNAMWVSKLKPSEIKSLDLWLIDF